MGRTDFLPVDAGSITLTPSDSLRLIGSSHFLSQGGRTIAESIIHRGRIFLHTFPGSTDPVPILDVTNFFNQQINTGLFRVLGSELAAELGKLSPQMLLTASSSGLIPTYAVAEALGDIPMTYAQKGRRVTFEGKRVFSKGTLSHTTGNQVDLAVSESALPTGTRVAIVDDFLATGRTIEDLWTIASQANCPVVAVAAIIEKTFEGGREKLKEIGFGDGQIISILKIVSMKPGMMRIEGIGPWLSLMEK